MILQRTVYTCPFCLCDFNSHSEATTCELLGAPEMKHQIGDVITFHNEEDMMGVRCSYTHVTGKVIYAYPYLLTGKAGHAWMYIVVSDAARATEFAVAYVDNRYGESELASLHGWKYNPGYADFIKQERQAAGPPRHRGAPDVGPAH